MRILIARILTIVAMAAPIVAGAAANPAGGTLSEAVPQLQYTGGPLLVADPEGLCPNAQVCETYNLTVSLPADFSTRRPDDLVAAELAGMASGDGVIAILDSSGNVIAEQDGPFVNGPETVTIKPVPGTTQYKVRVRLYAGSTQSYSVKIDLTKAAIITGGTGYAPRFQTLSSPPALGNGAAEPSIGYNLTTKRAMYQAGLQTLRVTFAEQRKDDPLNPNGLPESCDADWKNVSFPTTSTVSLDPIGLTDQTTGRYYAGQLSAKSHNMAFTDDDGDNWLPSVGNFPGAAGVDHQTIGWGPYVAGGTARPLTAYPNAIYYCSQDIAYANCSRSDDGGASFLPPVPAYTISQCGGLHGHIRAAPDGTVYLPNADCGGKQGVSVSEDNGVNWQVRTVPTSTAGNGSDPQMALANDGTGYFCYVGTDGRPRVAVTKDKAKTWISDIDIGGPVGVRNAVFPQSIAGDPDRAACGFLGSTTSGNYQSQSFPGIWHVYIASTYDGGATWSTTNVTPDDPAQGVGGIWMGGGSDPNRNLLDFNEMTLDEKGRAIYGFADGCIGTCVTSHSGRSDKAAIARVVGGRSLFASLDRPEPYVPQAACLSGTRTTDSAELTWRPPADDGKSDITGYKIFRGTTQGAQSQIASVGVKAGFSDFTANPEEPSYFYKVVAVNALGDSVFSNLIKLSLGVDNPIESVCVMPGLTILEDAEGDATGGVEGQDVRRLSISQPYSEDSDYTIFFHLKMKSLSTVPANTYWPINFCSPAFPCVNPDTNTEPYGANNKYYTVRMSTVPPGTPAAPLFEILKPTAAGNTAGSRTITALPAGAGGFTPAGLITIGVKASDLGLAPATSGFDKLQKFQVRIGANIGAGTITPDNMPDGLAGAGEFVTSELSFCAPNTPPEAHLVASSNRGPAELTVSFDASGSSDVDAGDTIVQYIFNFGDDTEIIAQSSPTISHTYTEAAFYNATVRVKDSRGLASASHAAQVIEVTAPGSTSGPGFENNRLGGALPLLGMLGLALAGLLTRRRRH